MLAAPEYDIPRRRRRRSGLVGRRPLRDGRRRAGGLFFSEELQDIARRQAPSAPSARSWRDCLEGALARREPWGVWGGQLFLNGKILATKRRRGRPPKVARPEDQLPEVPIPEHLRSA